MEVTVLGVQLWSMDNGNGSLLQGITVHYFDPADHESAPDRLGIFPASITADKTLFNKFSTLPGKYNFSLGLKRASGGKSKPVLRDVTFVPKA